jgi:SAM-dependent methyltransferase
MKQNIFDNPVFFDGYKNLRDDENNGNELLEKPCIFSLLPDLTGKNVLDMGCGYGENCVEFIRRGASFVQGIDISTKMLNVAMSENGGEKISYNNMGMEDIHRIETKFDVVISSLAVHYVSDFKKLVKDVFDLLNPGGTFIFSQEHPLTTAPLNGAKWGSNKEYYHLSDYSAAGERTVSWFVDNVTKYHRTFSDIVNTLTSNGFCIHSISEPVPSEEIMEKLPKFKGHKHKPNYLVVKAVS